MVLKCDKCSMEGEKVGNKCGTPNCTGKIKKMCEKSGQYPHGGKPPGK